MNGAKADEEKVTPLMSVASLYGYTVAGREGELGKLYTFLFDDHAWSVRYVVVYVGGWLSRRYTLLHSSVITGQDENSKQVIVSVSRDQVRASPDVDVDKPIARDQEAVLARHYGWAPDSFSSDREHLSVLRSTREVAGYYLQATDGDIGHVEDFILEEGQWIIRYLVVDTRNWLPGRKVLIAPQWIERVSWEEKKAYVDLSQEAVRDAPEYKPSSPLKREDEIELHDYYGRPPYWLYL